MMNYVLAGLLVVALLLGIIKFQSCQVERAKEKARQAEVQAELERRKATVKEKDRETEQKLRETPFDDIIDKLRRGDGM